MGFEQLLHQWREAPAPWTGVATLVTAALGGAAGASAAVASAAGARVEAAASEQ